MLAFADRSSVSYGLLFSCSTRLYWSRLHQKVACQNYNGIFISLILCAILIREVSLIFSLLLPVTLVDPLLVTSKWQLPDMTILVPLGAGVLFIVTIAVIFLVVRFQRRRKRHTALRYGQFLLLHHLHIQRWRALEPSRIELECEKTSVVDITI